MKTKKFEIEITTQEDFCSLDLSEVIKDGMDNVGNHTLIGLSIK